MPLFCSNDFYCIAALISIAHAYLGLSNMMSTVGTVVAIVVGTKANSIYPKLLLVHCFMLIRIVPVL